MPFLIAMVALGFTYRAVLLSMGYTTTPATCMLASSFAGLLYLLLLGLPVRRLAASLLRASGGIMSVCWLYLYATEVLHGNINGLMLAKGIKAHFNRMSLPNPINFRLHSTLVHTWMSLSGMRKLLLAGNWACLCNSRIRP